MRSLHNGCEKLSRPAKVLLEAMRFDEHKAYLTLVLRRRTPTFFQHQAGKHQCHQRCLRRGTPELKPQTRIGAVKVWAS